MKIPWIALIAAAFCGIIVGVLGATAIDVDPEPVIAHHVCEHGYHVWTTSEGNIAIAPSFSKECE